VTHVLDNILISHNKILYTIYTKDISHLLSVTAFLLKHFISATGFRGICAAQSLVFCVVFCRTLFVPFNILSFFFWQFHYLSFVRFTVSVGIRMHYVNNLYQTGPIEEKESTFLCIYATFFLNHWLSPINLTAAIVLEVFVLLNPWFSV
jgi:hypothetical protein